MALTAGIATPNTLFPTARFGGHCLKQKKSFFCHPNNVSFRPVALAPLCVRFRINERKSSITRGFRTKHASMICAASLTYAPGQTQTVLDNVSTITTAPTKVKLDISGGAELDNTGGDLPPRGNGGGGGGGGGGRWSGGLFFFGFLALLFLLKDQESEGDYHDYNRRRAMHIQ